MACVSMHVSAKSGVVSAGEVFFQPINHSTQQCYTQKRSREPLLNATLQHYHLMLWVQLLSRNCYTVTAFWGGCVTAAVTLLKDKAFSPRPAPRPGCFPTGRGSCCIRLKELSTAVWSWVFLATSLCRQNVLVSCKAMHFCLHGSAIPLNTLTVSQTFMTKCCVCRTSSAGQCDSKVLGCCG